MGRATRDPSSLPTQIQKHRCHTEIGAKDNDYESGRSTQQSAHVTNSCTHCWLVRQRQGVLCVCGRRSAASRGTLSRSACSAVVVETVGSQAFSRRRMGREITASKPQRTTAQMTESSASDWPLPRAIQVVTSDGLAPATRCTRHSSIGRGSPTGNAWPARGRNRTSIK